MNDPYAVVQCCDRLQEAVTEAKPSALHHRLQELVDLLNASDIDDPAFSEVRETASNLAEQAREIERVAIKKQIEAKDTIPDSFQRQATALCERVCQCYLRTAEIDTDTLPDADPTTDVIEELASEQAQLQAETAIWAARAKLIADERDSAIDSLNKISKKAKQIDTERQWSPDWEKFIEREREYRRKKEELKKNHKELKEKLE